MNLFGRATIFVVALQLFCLAGADPVTPNASATTKRLLQFFYDLSEKEEKRMLSGQFASHSTHFTNVGQVELIEKQTGQYVAILSADYFSMGDNFSAEPGYYKKANAFFKQHWFAGGLITLSGHIGNPMFEKAGIRDSAQVDIRPVLKPGTDANRRYLRDLEIVAEGLADLQKSGVVVLYRPLHEMNGGWFWYGKKEPALYKKLWEMTFEYMTVTKKLDNLIWIYSPNIGQGVMDYYPGDKRVDMVGLDAYVTNPNAFEREYKELIAAGKPFALCEYGPGQNGDPRFDMKRLLTALKTKYPKTVYFLAWHDRWGLQDRPSSKDLLNDPIVQNRPVPLDIFSSPDKKAPPVPKNLTASTTGSSASLAWAGVQDENGIVYDIFADGKVVGSTDSIGYCATGSRTKTRYFFTIRARDFVGNVSAETLPVEVSTSNFTAQDGIVFPYVQSGPTIDGTVDSLWSVAQPQQLARVLDGKIEDKADLSARFRGVWSDSALFLLVEVKDDKLIIDSPGSTWQDDQIELYVDADNSKAAYYGDNDYNFRANPNALHIKEVAHDRTRGVKMKIATVADGYTIELAFPWRTLRVTPEGGKVVGVDLHVNDDDDGGGRDAKISWWADKDIAWQDPSVFGAALLQHAVVPAK